MDDVCVWSGGDVWEQPTRSSSHMMQTPGHGLPTGHA